MAMQKMQNPNNLAALLQGAPQLLSLFAPKKSTVGGTTETTATNMSQEGLDAVLRQILESNQGLASVARGQRQAGLYNSSVNTLLTNDLMSRAAGEVAKINAPTTRTTSARTDRTEAPLSIGKTLGGVAAGTLLNAALKSDTAKRAGSSVLNAITGAFKGGGGSSSGWTSGFDLPMGSMGSVDSGWTSGFDLGGLDMGSSSSGWTSGFDLPRGGVSGDPMTFMSGSYGPVSAAADIYNILSSEDPGASTEQAIGAAVGGYFGGPVGSAVGRAVAEPVFEAGYDVLNVAEASVKDVFGAVEDTFYNVLDPIKDLGKSVGCFITTAVVELLGKADDCDELQTLRAFRDGWLKENHPEDIPAYYEVAPKILASLKTNFAAEQILQESYDSYILPAVDAIKNNRPKEAYQLYRDMVLMLSKAAALPTQKETE